MKIANKEFGNVLNEAEGLRVSAMYLSKFPFTGTILSVRVKYGGALQFRVATDNAIIWEEPRPVLLLNEKEIVEFLD